MKHITSKTFVLFFLLATFVFAQKDTLQNRKNSIKLNPLSELRDQLDDYFNDQNFNDAFIGVIIKSLKSGEVLYKRNADKLFVPASNMKLFTSAAALILLGADYQYETNLYTDGKIKKGVLHGNVIVQGSGDPSISGRFYDGNVNKVFENWADTLKSKGIWAIDGNIFGDDSLFDNVGLGKGWESDYESKWFAAPSGALSFNDNSLEIRVEPTQPNFPANVYLTPDTKYISVAAKVITVEGEPEVPISISRLRGTNLISISGEIRKGSQPFIDHISISDPTMYFLTILKEVLEKKWSTIIDEISGYLKWFRGIHFPIGTRKNDSLDIENMSDQMLSLFGKKIVSRLDRVVIENQQKNLGLFFSTKAGLDEIKRRNRINFTRLKKAGIL